MMRPRCQWNRRSRRQTTVGRLLGLLSVGLILSGLQVPDGMADPAKAGLFGYLEFASDKLTALPLWRDVLTRIAGDRGLIERCDNDVGSCSSTTMTVWRAKVHELTTLPVMRQLIEVNRFVNRFPAVAAGEAGKLTRRWASPLEFLGQGGTPADFAVMKFATLRDIGVGNDQMRVAVVYDSLKQQRHAVLAVSVGGETFILDTVTDAVLPANRLRYYVPYYSVNETTRWAHVVQRRRLPPGR